jgi:hypothetical protein
MRFSERKYRSKKRLANALKGRFPPQWHSSKGKRGAGKNLENQSEFQGFTGVSRGAVCPFGLLVLLKTGVSPYLRRKSIDIYS